MKLNLGCGADLRPGYVNVDFREHLGVDNVVDLSILPWPFASDFAEEIMMLDFLEHFPYRDTKKILLECWRVLVPDGKIVIQVPDFNVISKALNFEAGCICNRCGYKFTREDNLRADFWRCRTCPQDMRDIMDAAVARLFGGQDYEGNFHYAAFTPTRLQILLRDHGFHEFEHVERNENGETFEQNWNFKLIAKKGSLWDGGQLQEF
ncbi:hypothetical protein KW787_04335 [Candidatus Pacearchaeota archaeon]|nr:hypothetical protein [Candidatus Pacearchaeota archaeon]